MGRAVTIRQLFGFTSATTAPPGIGSANALLFERRCATHLRRLLGRGSRIRWVKSSQRVSCRAARSTPARMSRVKAAVDIGHSKVSCTCQRSRDAGHGSRKGKYPRSAASGIELLLTCSSGRSNRASDDARTFLLCTLIASLSCQLRYPTSRSPI